MKLFKKIPIEGYEKYEINQDGYVLHVKSGHITKLDYNYMFPSNSGEILPLIHIINYTFKDKEV